MATILITGASSGIGRALSVYLINAGHTIWGIARNEDKLRELTIEARSSRFFYFVCDVRKPEELLTLKTRMDACGFEPDILILNAGVTSHADNINHQTNYEGIINTWQVFKTGLQRRGGIVAVSGSLFALVPAPFNLSYSQSKLDALNFIKGLAQQNENQNIKFTYFVLGPVNTQPGNILPWWKSLVIPSPEKTAIYITKHLDSPGIINIFPFSSHVIILLNTILPKAVMNRLITFLKR